MKRKKLVQMLESNGWRLKREGGSHSIYTNGSKNEPVPKHSEIDEIIAQTIIKRCGLE